MALLFKSDADRAELWVPAIRARLPEMEVRVWPDLGDPDEIEYTLIWKPPAGLLAGFKNLKAIFSLGAGIDHLASDPKLPPQVPVVRMVERGLTSGMTEYVVMQTLFHHRRMLDYRDQQACETWKILPFVPAWKRRVGIMGLGVLGSDAAEKLATLRLDVAGWSRSPKALDGIDCYHGSEGLEDFLARTEILVCLVPLTDETRGILNAETFAKLPAGACIINAGRGGHLVEEDLLAALESGHIDSASLDVFHDEPLPAGHPFWQHPRVVVTPHVASITVPETAIESLAANVERMEAGLPLENVVDFKRGY